MNIDTLSIARDLKAAELPAGQAEAIAAAIGRSVHDSLATKADLDSTKAGLETKIEQVRTEIEQVRTEIERSRHQLLIGFVSSQIALAGIIIAVIKL